MLRCSTLTSFLFTAILLVTLLFNASCSIQQRHYRNGFYVESHGKRQATTTPARPSVADRAIENTVTETAIAEQAVEQAQQPVTVEPTAPAFAPTPLAPVTVAPDTFIVEEEQPLNLSKSQRIKQLLKKKQDEKGLPIVPLANTAYYFSLIGLATYIFSVGSILLLVALIMNFIALSNFKNAAEGTYSPDNILLIRRTFLYSVLGLVLIPLFFLGIFLFIFFL